MSETIEHHDYKKAYSTVSEITPKISINGKEYSPREGMDSPKANKGIHRKLRADSVLDIHREERNSPRSFSIPLGGVEDLKSISSEQFPANRDKKNSFLRWFGSSNRRMTTNFFVASPKIDLNTNSKDPNEKYSLTEFDRYKCIQVSDISQATKTTQISSKDYGKLQIIIEFFTNELSFLNSLSLIGRYYHDSLINEDVISLRDHKIIFPNFLQLFNLHQNFVHEMVQSIDKNTIAENFPNILYYQFVGEKMEETKKIWCRFMEGNVIGRNILKILIEKNHKLKTFMKNKKSESELKKMDLFDLFQTIHKHLAEYPIYIARFIKYTPPSVTSRGTFKQCEEGCRKLLESINDHIELAQNQEIMYQHCKMIESFRNDNKGSDYFPSTFDFLAENFRAYIDLEILSKRKKKGYKCLITTRYIFFINSKNDKYKIKPIEMITQDSSHECSIVMINLLNIINIIQSTANPYELTIVAIDNRGVKFHCHAFLRYKDTRPDLINMIYKTIEDLQSYHVSEYKEPSVMELEESLKILDLPDSLFKVDFCALSYNSEAYYEKIQNSLYRIIACRNTVRQYIQSRKLIINKTTWESCIDRISTVVEMANIGNRDNIISNINELIKGLNQFKEEIHREKTSALSSVNDTNQNINNLVKANAQLSPNIGIMSEKKCHTLQKGRSNSSSQLGPI